MKILNGLLLLLLFTIVFSSCEEQHTLEFEEPQPANVKNTTEFKRKFRGDYLSLEDSSILHILPNSLLRTNAFFLRIAKNELDTMKGWKISGHKLFGPDFKNGVSFQFKNDSIHFTLNSTDTLFVIDKNENILRYFKGHYFLNRKTSQNRWQLSSLGFGRNGNLQYSAVTDSTDLKNMQEITAINYVFDEEGNSVAQIAKPAHKEFKKFMKNGGFHKHEEFVSIK